MIIYGKRMTLQVLSSAQDKLLLHKHMILDIKGQALVGFKNNLQVFSETCRRLHILCAMILTRKHHGQEK